MRRQADPRPSPSDSFRTKAAGPTRPETAPGRAVPAAGRRRPSRGGLRAVTLYLLLALASLMVTGGTFLVVANPAELIRDRLAAQVRLRTGHDLVVKGGTSLTLLPSLGVVLRDVALAAGRDDAGPPVLTAQALTASLAWQPLTKGRIAVRSVDLRKPILDLSVDAEGRSNWSFAASTDVAPARAIRVAQLGASFQHGQGLPSDLYRALERSSAARDRARLERTGGLPRNVTFSDGTLRYSDRRSGVARQMDGINFQLQLEGSSAKISGSGLVAGERVTLDGEVQDASPRGATLALRISSQPFEATWSGRAALDSGWPELDGRIVARASSGAALAAWLGKAASADILQGPAGVEGRLSVSGAMLHLSDASLTLDDATATGTISVDPTRQRPHIKADVKITELRLGRGSAAEGADEKGRSSATPADNSGSTGSIGDLLRRTEDEDRPRTKSRAQSRGWSAAPIDLGMLRLADLTGQLEIERLWWRELNLGAARATVSLDGGVLKAEAEGMDLYGGRGRAVLSVREEGSAAALSLTASAEDAATLALMSDAAGFDWIEGRGRLSLAVTARGASEAELMQHLKGQAEFKVTDGAVIGWNVAHMLRKLRQGQLTAVERDMEAKTPFVTLAGSFSIVDGVASNHDLAMTGPAVELAGAGTVALAQRSVDYTVRPTIATAAVAAGSGAQPPRIAIPVRIHGAWANPRFAVDLQGALNDPRTAEAIQQIGRRLRNGDVEDVVKSLFGDGPEAEKKAAKAKEFLKRFQKP